MKASIIIEKHENLILLHDENGPFAVINGAISHESELSYHFHNSFGQTIATILKERVKEIR